VQVLHLILQCLSSLIFLLFGEGECLSLLLKKYPNLQKKVYICHKDELILVYTKQGMAIRSLKCSSMRLALEAHRRGKTRFVFFSREHMFLHGARKNHFEDPSSY
jgi:fatty acid/phospholipid biosynthesis enzyme